MSFSFEINPRLLIDISHRSQENIKPINDYQQGELVSLEQACQPLENLLDAELQLYITVARLNSQQSKHGLTQDESASIYLYTMEWNQPQHSLYVLLNQVLCTMDRNQLQSWSKYLKLLFTALFKLPYVEYHTVWRGVAKDIRENYREGDEVTCTLNLCNNAITSVGASVLSQAFVHGTYFFKIILDKNPLLDAGIQFLARGLATEHTGVKFLHLNSLEKALSRFEINDLSDITFVSDRDANFVKALKHFQAYSCAAHRLSNIVKNRDQEDYIDMVPSNDVDVGEEEDSESLINITTLAEVPRTALHILQNVIELLFLFFYAGLNQEIKEHGGVSLKQSINVRWWSFINLLESIERSLYSIKTVLAHMQKSFATELEIIHGLIRLLLPFKESLIKFQTSLENETYSQQENLSSLDSNDSRSIDEDEGLRCFRLRLLQSVGEMFSTFEPVRYTSSKISTFKEK
ncbi:hypothetical protein I4U23_011456 [Adineta vaga]|nr:hypothetical protein I4U23_011456 [Adineta vaga]